MSIENRPRERLSKYGASVLSDAELLAVILQKGTAKDNVIDMSNRLLSKYGMNKLSELSLKELQEIKGIGVAKAMQIKAVFELSKRYKLSRNNKKPIICAKDVYEYACERILDKNKEQFMILHLDSKNRVIKDEIVSIGTLNASIIHPREVFKSAIKESVNSIILVHNHPSGDVTPSSEDEEITMRLFEAGKLLDIKVLDHVIVGDGYWSWKER
jgi:DNA repair protein RadC